MRFCVNFYQRVNSLLEVTQDEIIKMYLHVKAFVEMSSPMDCLPWVFPCHVSVGPKPITYSCGFTVELGFGCHLLTHDTQFKAGVWSQVWEMKIAVQHLSWVGLHLLLIKSFIHEVIWQETSHRNVSFSDGNICSLLYFWIRDTLNIICMYIYIHILPSFPDHTKNINCFKIQMKILLLESGFCLV